MSIFNFGHRQRMHTQLYGNTSGREMFKVDEYSARKKTTLVYCTFILLMAVSFYLDWNMAILFKGLPIIIFVLLSVGCFFNYKQQRRLREELY